MVVPFCVLPTNMYALPFFFDIWLHFFLPGVWPTGVPELVYTGQKTIFKNWFFSLHQSCLGLNLGPQPWWRVPLSTVPSYKTSKCLICSMYFLYFNCTFWRANALKFEEVIFITVSLVGCSFWVIFVFPPVLCFCLIDLHTPFKMHHIDTYAR